MNLEALIEYANLMTVRRDHWRDKAEIAQAQNEALQKQLDYWQEVARNRKQRNNELAQLVRLLRMYVHTSCNEWPMPDRANSRQEKLMAQVGTIQGQLKLQIGTQTLNLGEVIIPLRARNLARKYSGSDEMTVSIEADLKQVREYVQAVFGERSGE